MNFFEMVENKGFLNTYKIVKLKGRNNEFRLRLGDHRLLFKLSKNDYKITISAILGRKKVYK